MYTPDVQARGSLYPSLTLANVITNKQVSIDTAFTKLSELKHILAREECFGSKAPVKRQRIFYLGRELKSGGRSLCNLGLGKFNNRILHLYVRPGADGTGETGEDEKGDNSQDGEGSAVVNARKRNRGAAATSTQQSSRQRNNTNNSAAHIYNTGSIHNGSSTSGRPASRNYPPVVNNNNLAIDLVDSSDDDDEVEVIEVL